jgi:hypothetical protein
MPIFSHIPFGDDDNAGGAFSYEGYDGSGLYPARVLERNRIHSRPRNSAAPFVDPSPARVLARIDLQKLHPLRDLRAVPHNATHDPV